MITQINNIKIKNINPVAHTGIMCISSPKSFDRQLERHKSHNRPKMTNEQYVEAMVKLCDVKRGEMKSPSDIISQLKKRKMQKFYEYVDELYEVYDEDEAKFRLTDEELDIAKNLFRVVWNNRRGGQQADGSRLCYCVNDYELAKCLLKNVVNFDDPRYANSTVNSHKLSKLEEIVHKGLIHDYKNRRTCML